MFSQHPQHIGVTLNRCNERGIPETAETLGKTFETVNIEVLVAEYNHDMFRESLLYRLYLFLTQITPKINLRDLGAESSSEGGRSIPETNGASFATVR